MFCPKCGNQLREGAKFCSKCGAKAAVPFNQGSSAGRREAEAAGQTAAARQPETDGRTADGQPGERQRKVAPEKAGPVRPPVQKKPVENAQGTMRGKPPKKNKKGLIAGLLILLLILVLASGGAVIYFISQKDDGEILGKRSGEDRRQTQEIEDEKEADEEQEEKPESRAPAPDESTEPGSTEETIPDNAAAPVSCSVVYANQVDLRGLVRADVQKNRVSQSTYVIQSDRKIDNTGWSAFDGNSTTSWQEGIDGDGVGEFVTAGFDQEVQVSVITFLLGNHRSDSWFYKNNRPKTLLINLDETLFQADFPDEKEEFALVFSSPVPASSITATIGAVYKGTQYTDTVIAEIGVYGN